MSAASTAGCLLLSHLPARRKLQIAQQPAGSLPAGLDGLPEVDTNFLDRLDDLSGLQVL